MFQLHFNRQFYISVGIYLTRSYFATLQPTQQWRPPWMSTVSRCFCPFSPALEELTSCKVCFDKMSCLFISPSWICANKIRNQLSLRQHSCD